MDRTSPQPVPELRDSVRGDDPPHPPQGLARGRSRDLTLDLCACARSAGSDAVTVALLGCPGVEQVHVDTYVTWALTTFDPARATPDSIIEHMAGAGYDVRLARLFDPDVLTSVSESAPLPCPPLPSVPVEELP